MKTMFAKVKFFEEIQRRAKWDRMYEKCLARTKSAGEKDLRRMKELYFDVRYDFRGIKTISKNRFYDLQMRLEKKIRNRRKHF